MPTIDPTLIMLPLLLVLGVICAAAVCIVALLRADRSDTVDVVRALPSLVTAFLRDRRRPRR